MKKETVVAGVIGLLAGVIITGFVAGQAVNNHNTGMMHMMGMHTDDHNSEQQESIDNHSAMSMTDMTDQLRDKTGDDFDKAFIEMMIAHHEGAVGMAGLIPTRAKHDDIKRLGEAIIAAQTKEISEMRQWQKDWGYGSNEMMMHNH